MCENFVCLKLTEMYRRDSAERFMPESCFEQGNCQICECMYNCDYCLIRDRCNYTKVRTSEKGKVSKSSEKKNK